MRRPATVKLHGRSFRKPLGLFDGVPSVEEVDILEGDEGPAGDGAADKERWGRSEERDMAKSAGDESNMVSKFVGRFIC